jgi:hypothetical protein
MITTTAVPRRLRQGEGNLNPPKVYAINYIDANINGFVVTDQKEKL